MALAGLLASLAIVAQLSDVDNRFSVIIVLEVWAALMIVPAVWGGYFLAGPSRVRYDVDAQHIRASRSGKVLCEVRTDEVIWVDKDWNEWGYSVVFFWFHPFLPRLRLRTKNKKRQQC